MTKRNRWPLFLLASLVLGAVALAASPAGAWLLHPVTPVARDVRTLFYKAVAITSFFFIIAEGILLVAVLKFSAKPGVSRSTFVPGYVVGLPSLIGGSTHFKK